MIKKIVFSLSLVFLVSSHVNAKCSDQYAGYLRRYDRHLEAQQQFLSTNYGVPNALLTSGATAIGTLGSPSYLALYLAMWTGYSRNDELAMTTNYKKVKTYRKVNRLFKDIEIGDGVVLRELISELESEDLHINYYELIEKIKKDDKNESYCPAGRLMSYGEIETYLKRYF